MAEATPDAKSEWDAVAAERDTPATTPEPVAVIDDATPAQAAVADPVAAPAAAAPVVDPYAGLSPDVKAKLERVDALLTTVQQQGLLLKETQGRMSSMQSEFAKTRQALPAGDAPSSTAVAQAAKDPEKWAALKKDFPEWGEGIEAFVDARAAALKGSGLTPEQVEQMVASRVGTATAELSTKFEHALVGMKYPAWNDEVKTPEFEAWFAAQKPDVQALAQSPKGTDAVQMLDLFHESKKTPAVRQSRAKTLEAAVTGKPGTPAGASAKSFDDLTPKQQWEYLAAERERKQAAAA